tara:strand:- start:4584 stop:4835 length:252 start_codon:yes stop_codon:yes gene_type:complete
MHVFEHYGIIQTSDLSNIDFSQIGETSENTLRYNLAGTEFVIKWDNEPTFISSGLVLPVQVLTHSEALTLMATEEWTLPDPIE